MGYACIDLYGHRLQGLVGYFADLYDAWGEPKKAAEWRAKLPDEVNSNEQDD